MCRTEWGKKSWAALTLALLAASPGCGQSSSQKAVSLTLTPAIAKVPVGLSQQFTATVTYADHSTADITGVARWSVSDAGILRLSSTLGAEGVVSAVKQGTATLTATFAGVSASVSVTGAPPLLQTLMVGPGDTMLAVKTQQQLTATGLFSDGSKQDLTSQALWTSSDPSIAVVSNEGTVQATAPGLAVVNATVSGEVGATSVRVSSAFLTNLQINAPVLAVPLGTSLQLAATGIFSDQSNQAMTDAVQWSSSDPQIATVSSMTASPGVVTPLGVGVVTVTATAFGITASQQLDVTQATLQSLLIQPNDAEVITGTPQQYQVFGLYSDGTRQDLTGQVNYTSDTPTVATINATGLLQAVAPGQAKVIATIGQARVATFVHVENATLSSIAITPKAVTMPGGLTQQLTSTATYSNGVRRDITSEVTWITSDPALVTVSNAAPAWGLVTSAGTPGTVTVTASMNAVSATATVGITSATLTQINLMPAVPSIANGTEIGFAADGEFSDGRHYDLTNLATWLSSDPLVATASNVDGSRGIVRGVGVGTTDIQAAWQGQSATTTMTVTSAQLAALSLSPANPSLAAGGTLQLRATGIYTDGSTQDLTGQAVWTSSVPGTASVSNSSDSIGVVTGVAAGGATIIAAVNGFTASTDVSVH